MIQRNVLDLVPSTLFPGIAQGDARAWTQGRIVRAWYSPSYPGFDDARVELITTAGTFLLSPCFPVTFPADADRIPAAGANVQMRYDWHTIGRPAIGPGVGSSVPFVQVVVEIETGD